MGLPMPNETKGKEMRIMLSKEIKIKKVQCSLVNWIIILL